MDAELTVLGGLDVKGQGRIVTRLNSDNAAGPFKFMMPSEEYLFTYIRTEFLCTQFLRCENG